MIVIGSYHKTGTAMFSAIWESYFGESGSYKAADHFNEVPDDSIRNTKCVVIVRNPYEIVMSGMRYHQITCESWCNQGRAPFNGLSYKQRIRGLSDDDKITFEMENCAKSTISAIYDDMKNRNFNDNVLFIKLEDLYDRKNVPDICRRIRDHCRSHIEIDSDRLADCFLKNLDKPYHRTNERDAYTFHNSFKQHHIDRFCDLFPQDTLDVLGYSDARI